MKLDPNQGILTVIEIPKLSPNRSARIKTITAIILHDTVGKIDGALSWLCNDEAKASSHVVIAKDGKIFRLVGDDEVAWHAGISALHGEEMVNAFSLGVELERWKEDDSTITYPQEQLNAAAEWIAGKCNQYTIPLNRIVSHAAIALPHGRKIDPRDFPWYHFMIMIAKFLI